MAVFQSLGGQGRVPLGGRQGLLQEVVPHGEAFIGGMGLLVVGGVGVEAAEVGHIAGVAVAGVIVVVAQFRSGELGIAHGGGGGPGLEEAGVPNQQRGHQNRNHHAHNGVGYGFFPAGGLLLLGLEALFRSSALALLFLSGCAHYNQSSQILSVESA